MFKWIREILAWEKIFESGVYSYYENSITGDREAIKTRSGYSPLDRDWLLRTKTPLKPPFGGSGVMK